MKWKHLPGNERHRRQARFLFWEQNGLCAWCKQPMVLIQGQHIKHPPDNLCTVDHLDDKLNPNRGKHGYGTRRRVAACKKCNEQRSNKRVKVLPLEELHRRSGHYPRA